jgi:hypothetical protein
MNYLTGFIILLLAAVYFFGKKLYAISELQKKEKEALENAKVNDPKEVGEDKDSENNTEEV